MACSSIGLLGFPAPFSLGHLEHACLVGSTLGEPWGFCTQSHPSLEKVHWDRMPEAPPLVSWVLTTLPTESCSLVSAVCYCHLAAAAHCHIGLEIEIVCWAPEPFPLLCCHSSGGPICAALVGGASLGGIGDWICPGYISLGIPKLALARAH